MDDETIDRKNFEKEALNEDLEYLLNGDKTKDSNGVHESKPANGPKKVNGSVVNIHTAQAEKLEQISFSKKEKMRIKALVTDDDIKKDIDDIVFSTDEEADKLTKPNGKRKPKSGKNRSIKNGEPKSLDPEDPVSGTELLSTKPKKTKKQKENNTSKEERKESSPEETAKSSIDTEESTKNPDEGKEKKRRSKKKKPETSENDDRKDDLKPEETDPEAIKTEKKEKKKQKKKEKKEKKEEIKITETTEPSDPKPQPNENSNKPKEEAKNGSIEPAPKEPAADSPFNIKLKSVNETPDAPFNVKLRSVKSTHANKKYIERLPQVQPIETIMGLSNEQIYKLNPSDIKLKSIITQADKTLKTIINFAMENEEMFKNEETKTIFVDLCINIALYESRGLNKTCKRYPNVIELFSGFEALTLDFNNTVFTKSDRAIHQNSFDYSILSYIGNIIIWINSINNLSYVPKKLTRQSIGGYYLWDQLFKEDSINMKRWKHIIKFRDQFPFQINQFIVIMKFMHVGI